MNFYPNPYGPTTLSVLFIRVLWIWDKKLALNIQLIPYCMLLVTQPGVILIPKRGSG